MFGISQFTQKLGQIQETGELLSVHAEMIEQKMSDIRSSLNLVFIGLACVAGAIIVHGVILKYK